MKQIYDLQQILWPCPLPNIVKRSILNLAQMRTSVKGIDVCQSLCPMPGIFYVIRGSSGLCLTTSEMKNSLGGVVGRGDWIGAYALELETEIFLLAEEVEPVSLLFFPKGAILRLAEHEPLVYKWLYACARKEQEIWLQAMLSSIHEKSMRVAYLLLEFSKRIDVIQGSLTCINVSQYQLSALSGISRARLNEVLKKLEYDGFILLQRGKVFIKDVGLLSDYISSMNLMFRDPRPIDDSSFS